MSQRTSRDRRKKRRNDNTEATKDYLEYTSDLEIRQWVNGQCLPFDKLRILRNRNQI